MTGVCGSPRGDFEGGHSYEDYVLSTLSFVDCVLSTLKTYYKLVYMKVLYRGLEWRRGGHVTEESKLDDFGHNTTQSLSDRL